MGANWARAYFALPVLMAAILGGCQSTPSLDAMTGTFLDAPTGQPVVELTRTGSITQAVVTFRGGRYQGQCVDGYQVVKTKFFTKGWVPDMAALYSASLGCYIITSREGVDFGGHKMATAYCFYSEAHGFVDLYRK